MGGREVEVIIRMVRGVVDLPTAYWYFYIHDYEVKPSRVLTIPPEIKGAVKRVLDEEGFKYGEYRKREGEWLYETIEGSLIGEEYEALLVYCHGTSDGYAECTISIYGEPIARLELRSVEQVQELREKLRLAKKVLEEVRRRSRESRVAVPLKELISDVMKELSATR